MFHWTSPNQTRLKSQRVSGVSHVAVQFAGQLGVGVGVGGGAVTLCAGDTDLLTIA